MGQPAIRPCKVTWERCCSEAKPSPYTVLARLSAHCPNFWEVFVKVMLGVMVLLMMACGGKEWGLSVKVELLYSARWTVFSKALQHRMALGIPSHLSFTHHGAIQEPFTSRTPAQVTSEQKFFQSDRPCDMNGSCV